MRDLGTLLNFVRTIEAAVRAITATASASGPELLKQQQGGQSRWRWLRYNVPNPSTAERFDIRLLEAHVTSMERTDPYHFKLSWDRYT